ncbi:MAG: hypothetical protein ACE5GN_05055 [Waddliaceae bacterium]
MKKTNITVPELASTIVRFLKVTDLEKNEMGANNPKVFNEIMFLKVFAIDVAIYSALRDTGQREAVRDAYYAAYHAKLLEITKDPSCFGKIADRLEIYGEAIRSSCEGGQANIENVGYAFTEFCEKESLVTAARGTVIFGCLCKAAKDFINSFNIILS